MAGEVFVVTASGTGHLLPCIELCYHISSRNYKTTLVLASSLTASIPSYFHRNPLHSIAELTPVLFSAGSDDAAREQSGRDLEVHLSSRLAAGADSSPRLLCAIVDFPMAWMKHIFWKFHVPIISFFTFGACTAAMEYGAWKARMGDLVPGEIRAIPGLPEEMSLAYSELQRYPRGGGGGGRGPKLGNQPPWLPMIEGSIGLMFNTCEDLERPFLGYIGREMGFPVWAVGPLLPARYWAATASASFSLIRDGEVRGHHRDFSITEEELIRWLDSKPRASVLFISFGSTVSPTPEENQELAGALEESRRPFIWVVQSGSGHGLDGAKIGGSTDQGLVIRGWAPQLLILSHPSTGGFLSHCGWSSTVEAIGLGVPILGWPIRGDQHLNAKLVVAHLRIGCMASKRGPGEMVRKEDLVGGIEELMSDHEVKGRAMEISSSMFVNGFPKSSELAFHAFRDFLDRR
ncbi:hypothetical protein Dimus_009693 [Dionaea muscipula]